MYACEGIKQWFAKTHTIDHRVDRVPCRLSLQSSELGLPTPSPEEECFSPTPFGSGGGLACGRGVGRTQFGRGERL
jgi:hypothetical protein